ncbi:MAG: fluoride efflux transporter CrcB [Spirochaetia bacterium]|jgi:CrcB protein|nr:fluoride efflux transporter CrcB [Candidatus Omnitrophota bacterium]MDX9784140.1 fluoride efflux transporter CrcB [Spirochaetia bacterium]
MATTLIIFAGGGLGALARYALSRAITGLLPAQLPWGTFFVNVTGSFLIGLVLVLVDAALLHPSWRAFAAVGFIGAFTTFSTYAFETVALLQKRAYGPGLWNFLLNNTASLIAVALGMALASLILVSVKGQHL